MLPVKFRNKNESRTGRIQNNYNFLIDIFTIDTLETCHMYVVGALR